MSLTQDPLNEASEPGVVLVEYFSIGDRLMAFVLRAESEHAEVIELPVTRPDSERFAREHLIAPTLSGRRPLSQAEGWRFVASGLVQPILRLAQEGELLWFVGHGALHLLPLHAAPLNGGTVIDRHPVCYAPSATVMRFCQARHKRRRRSALVVGDPEGDLWYAAEEARSVASLFNAEALLGTAATKERVLESCRTTELDVLHFACHGFFHLEDPMSSGIVLGGGLGPDEDGGPAVRLTANDLLSLSIHPALVTLSACRSGVQQLRPGDELLGLARALLYAGTPSAVISLWNVEDLSAQLLMERFYESLLGTAPVPAAAEGDDDEPEPRPPTLAAALRDAQLHVRDLDAATVVGSCDQALVTAGDDHQRRISWLVARSRAHATAGDFGAAAHDCAEAAAAQHQVPGVRSEERARGLDRSAALLRLKARRGSSADYRRRPFADPFHWAPFLLFGDWR